MNSWRCLLLVYPEIDVRLPGSFGFAKRFVHELPANERQDALDSFQSFPSLVCDLTDGAAGIDYDIITAERPLATLTIWKDNLWWPSPTDTGPELERHAPPGRYASIFVLWPQHDFQAGKSVKTGGWGFGMGPSPWSNCATYATVANARTWAWQIPLPGEVWLHKWLHGVCAYHAQQGHGMPAGDADGADRHGYTRSPQTGWTSYYRDLMSARVVEDGQPLGIPPAAWRDPFRYELSPD